MPVEVRQVTQAYKFALDPTPTITRRFTSHAGGARFAYNWGLARTAEALDAYAAEKTAGVDKPTVKVPSHFDLCKAWTVFKDDPVNGVGWVGENFVGTYQAALRDAAQAWSRFFKSRSGKLAGARVGRPRFKSKHRARRSFQVHGSTLRVSDAHHVVLPKIGPVKTHESTRKLLRRVSKGTARVVRGTVSQHSDGRWYIALTVEVQREVRTGPSARQRAGGTVGLDLGVRSVAVDSDGTVYDNPRFLEGSLARLAAAQRVLSRRLAAAPKGAPRSGRARKAQARVARLHARVGFQRADFLHKLSTSLVHGHERIAVEGWDVARVAATGSEDVPARVRRGRNRALADTGVGMLRWQVVSKSVWYGCDVAVLGKHESTGRTCSSCGQVRTKPVLPAEDTFRCPGCGWSGDRRVNSARVVARLAAEVSDASSGGESLNARGEGVSPVVPRGGRRSSGKREARARPIGRGESGTPGP